MAYAVDSVNGGDALDFHLPAQLAGSKSIADVPYALCGPRPVNSAADGYRNGPNTNHGRTPAKAPESATPFEQFEAIVDSDTLTAEQKCILVKIRCRVDGKTFAGAIVSNEGLMRAASLKDPRALRAELRELQGKARDLPEKRNEQGRPVNDPIDPGRATIIVEERPGRASTIAFTPERLNAIVAAYLQLKEQRRGPGRPRLAEKPPAQHAEGFEGKPPASGAPPSPRKPPASGTGGLEKPPASHAENPLRQTHPDPFLSKKEEERGADAPAPEEASATKKPPRRPSKPKVWEEEIDAAVAAYNEAAEKHGWTACRTLTDTRRHRLVKRLPEIGGVEGFKRALTAIPNNDFLMGRAPPRPGQQPFKLDIEKLLSTGSGMGDVLAKLLDDAGAVGAAAHPAAMTVEQLTASEQGRGLLARLGPEAGMRRIREIAASAAERCGR